MDLPWHLERPTVRDRLNIFFGIDWLLTYLVSVSSVGVGVGASSSVATSVRSSVALSKQGMEVGPEGNGSRKGQTQQDNARQIDGVVGRWSGQLEADPSKQSIIGFANRFVAVRALSYCGIIPAVQHRFHQWTTFSEHAGLTLPDMQL